MPAGTGVLRDLTLTGDQGMTLGADVTVNGVCSLPGSDIATGAYVLTLGPAASLVESDSMTVIGTARATRTASQSVNQTFGGLGLEVNAGGGAPGVTTVTRVTGTALDINGTAGIQRYFDVSPANNAGLGATVVLHYDESELNGIDENNLVGWAERGGAWTKLSSTVDATNNAVTITGVNVFETLTLGPGIATGVEDGPAGIPTAIRLASIHPNPFHLTTRIVFELSRKTAVHLAVYDVGGRLVSTLVNGVLEAGRHSATWQGVDDSGFRPPSGTYFCRMRAGSVDQTMRMVLLR
jgi:hypothetical protein